LSGNQIGTVIGGAIGAYFGAGNPAAIQLGMAIGGIIGGAVDPTHINGPKIGDGQQQSATDGNSIAWIQGTAMVAGTIVQVSSRRQIRHKDGGKGGPVQVTYTAVQDFAILICESSELRDSTMNSVLMVMQDGKIVYDVRPGSTMLADSYKWKANVDFLFGAEDQLPHPTLEAITGIGNTPAYRGSCIAVFKNFDVSSAGDRIPSFQFVVSSADTGLTIDEPVYGWKYLRYLKTADPGDCSAPSFDDSAWPSAPLPLANPTEAANSGIVPFTGTLLPDDTGAQHGIWIRRTLAATPGVAATVYWRKDDNNALYWNGVLIASDSSYSPLLSPVAISASDVKAVNTVALRVVNVFTVNTIASLKFVQAGSGAAAPSLEQICERICARGGLSALDFDATALSSTTVIGYPIARQANAADCLLPVLQAYFAFGSEYEAKLNFEFYGADAAVTVDRADLIEGNDSNKSSIVSNLRNQATEFPRRVVASYMDPAQNYSVVDVAAERRAVDVIAIGDQSFQVPVVMSADDAAKAADRALKVAYATLEGTLEYSTPFAGSDVYLRLVAGEPLLFQGKRYVADEMVLGVGGVKFTTRYDRQSAYTSSVQAITGNAPIPPSSPYSGPTTLIPMNLPAQRPQDSVGVYIAAASADGRDSWQGCTVQASYDGMASWQNALTIRMESTIGSIAIAATTSSEPITVITVKYGLESATAPQLAAAANAFAVVSASTQLAQLAQFGAAAEVTANQFQLTSITHSLGGTIATAMAVGDQFTLMDAAYFLPIDPSLAGRTLYFRGIGFGEAAEDATIYSLVYAALARADSAPFITEDGLYQFTTESGTLALSTE